MTTTRDWWAYYAEMDAELREVQRHVRDWPEIERARTADESPTIRLLCARGHEIRPVWLSEDHRGNLIVVPVHSQRPHRGRATATAVDPLSTRANRTSRVCDQVGCPTRIDYEGTCVKHGAWKSDDTTSRTRFDCPRCPFTETVRPARLLKLYAVALRLGREDMPLR